MNGVYRILCANRGSTGVAIATDSTHLDRMFDDCSWKLDDLGLDDAPPGISIWTGTVEIIRAGAEQDFTLNGKFRQPTAQEWKALQFRQDPWDLYGVGDIETVDVEKAKRAKT